jgi:hypothetical protein
MNDAHAACDSAHTVHHFWMRVNDEASITAIQTLQDNDESKDR